jgi:carbonic anhydrase/acetyltransferase-like protein (isoleucine patch superfamily)
MTIRNFNSTTPTLGNKTFVDTTAVVIGDVFLDDDVSIWPMCVLRGDVNSIHIGARTNIQDGTIIHVNHKTINNPEGDRAHIGEDVTVGHQAVIHACTIKDRVLVGIGTKVLDNAVIESDVMIGAGSLVPPNKVLQSGFLYFGSPVKQIRPLTKEELQHLKDSALHYVDLKNQHMAIKST